MAFGCTITVDTGKIPSSQSNFVWLATADNFPTAAKDGGASSILNGGGNLRCYTSSDKLTQLPIEVVTFVTGGSPVIQVWGLSPTINVASTVYIEADDVATTQPAFGDPFGRNAVWINSAFKLSLDDVSAPAIDSSGNINTADESTVLYQQPAKIGDGVSLIDAGISSADTSSFDILSSYSISFWADISSISNWGSFFRQQNNLNIQRNSGSGELTIRQGGASLITTDGAIAILLTGVMSHYRFDWDGITWRLYVDGDLKISSAYSTIPTVSGTYSLMFENSSTNIDCLLDNYNFENVSRSVDYSEGEYNNQNDPATFWSTSAWVDSGGGITITPDSINSEESFGIPTVSLSSAFISPLSITSQESFGVPVIVTAAIIVTPTSITSEESFGVPVILFDQAVLVQSIPSEESFGIPIISDGQAIIIPLEFRGTSNKIAEYLISTGKFTKTQVNDIIVEWLKLENTSGETFNDLFYNYWETQGLNGAYADKQDKWENEV